MDYNWDWGAFPTDCGPGILQERNSWDVEQRPSLVSTNSRKRSSRAAGFKDELGDLLITFDRKLKLSKAAKRNLKIADEAAKNPVFVSSVMKYLPESSIMALSRTCRQWRNLAFETVRERKGNRPFSIMWLDRDFQRFNDGDVEATFSFITYYHPTLLFGSPSLELSGQSNSMEAAEVMENSIPPLKQRVAPPLNKVNLILTYGSGNMAEFLSDEDSTQSKAMYPQDCVGLYTLSSSVVVSSPDNSKLIKIFPGDNTEDRLLSSVMFPACSHLVFETFIVPSDVSNPATYPCISEVIGDMDGTKTPKVLILYQYLSLADSKPGIVDVLQSLKTTAGSNGFPMATGIYDWVHGKLSYFDDISPAASGLLISGDCQCDIEVFVVDLLDSLSFETKFALIKQFYDDRNDFSCRKALLFYHSMLVTDGAGLFSFRHFLSSFHTKLPDVPIHGLGSLTGAHPMLVNADSAASWNELNLKMVKCGTTDSTLTRDGYRLVLVLLAYQAN